MRLRIVLILLLACGAAANLTLIGEAAAPAEPYHEVWIAAGSAEDIAALAAHGIIVHDVADRAVRAWVRESTLGLLNRVGIPYYPVEEPEEYPGTAKQNGFTYPSYAEMTQALQNFHSLYPDISALYTLGKSVEGRELWALLITANPGVAADKPAFKYVSTMHGDEPLGTPLMMLLIERLLTGYMVDPRITGLVNETEIWIVPLMNPDGYARTPRIRRNAAGIDLNRDFPQFPNEFTGFAFDGAPLRDLNRQPETRHVMQWSADRSFVLSANIHTGALVVNYPYDTDSKGSNFSPTPDEDVFQHVSLVYAQSNPPMFASTQFTNGVTNGAAWFSINGGMQDWNYRYLSCKEVTLELSVAKTPPESQIAQFWLDNEESLLAYIEQVHIGVRGIVTDANTGEPLHARVRVSGRAQPVFTNPDVGNYHRLLLPGEYMLTFEAAGYQPLSVDGVVVTEGPAGRLDVALQSASDVVTVPNVVGLQESAAATALGAASLAVGEITRVFDDAPLGEVLSQTPAAGTTALPGDAVSLQVSQGPAGGLQIHLIGEDTGEPVTNAVLVVEPPLFELVNQGGGVYSNFTPASDFVVTVISAPPYATPVSFPVTTAAGEIADYEFELWLPIPGDINIDRVVDAADVQLVINAALGLSIGAFNADLTDDDEVNALDVQLVVNATLGQPIGTPETVPGGHALFFGPAAAAGPPFDADFPPAALELDPADGPWRVTVYLHRPEDAGATHPSTLNARVSWNPQVLFLARATPHPLLEAWYGKRLSVSTAQALSGTMRFVITGSADGRSPEITTFDNQLPDAQPETGTPLNPFPLFTLEFVALGAAGAASTLSFPAGVLMADADANLLGDTPGLENSVVIAAPPPGELAGDINGDGVVNAVDVQLVINAALGLDIDGLDADVNGDGVVNAVDVQLVINAALGMPIG